MSIKSAHSGVFFKVQSSNIVSLRDKFYLLDCRAAPRNDKVDEQPITTNKVNYNLYSMLHILCHRVGAQHQWRLPLVIASHRRWRGDPVIIESRIRAGIIYWIASLRSQ